MWGGGERAVKKVVNLVKWKRPCAAREGRQAWNLRLAEIGQEVLRLLGSDFKRPRKPTAERAIQQGITHEEHENDRKERQSHGADDHFSFEACAELLLTPLGPKSD